MRIKLSQVMEPFKTRINLSSRQSVTTIEVDNIDHSKDEQITVIILPSPSPRKTDDEPNNITSVIVTQLSSPLNSSLLIDQ